MRQRKLHPVRREFSIERDLKKRFFSLFEEKDREESRGLVRENLSLFRHFRE